MNITATSLLAGLVLATLPAVASAASCEDYPYTVGINVENVKGGTKIISTASVSVSIDDMDEINDAREEATMEAKAKISKFMSEDIKSDTSIDKAVNETKSMDGSSKQVLREETKKTLKSLRNSSKALLRGVVPLGSCYTQSRELRVSVGIKPETIASAGNLAGGISDSMQGRNARSTDNGGMRPRSQGLQGSSGFSDTKRLDNF